MKRTIFFGSVSRELKNVPILMPRLFLTKLRSSSNKYILSFIILSLISIFLILTSFSCKKAVSLHRRTFAKSRTEIFRCETELKKVSKERDSLKILYVKKEGEIIDLRVELTKACQERSKFIKKFHQKGESVLQLLEDPKMKEAETLGWRQGMDNLVSEKETLRE
uniref:Uncharacterized protein isoform X1 n=1 Tax=Nicotiana tabacum TaxID=4097 RepID=A0A1S3WYF3_TOBAC|nr:PREDICTED: uncharacterized protein LOC107759281 isoform X1 [Nicotiana tabacum]